MLGFEAASSQFLNLGTNISTLQNVAGATLMAWVHLHGDFPPGGSPVITYSVGSATPTDTSRAAMEILATGQLRALARSLDGEGSRVLDTPSALSLFTVMHIAIVINYTDSILAVFQDGNLIIRANVTAFGSPTTSNTPSRNAAMASQDQGTTGFLDGHIDDARTYNRALSDNEIETIYGCKGVDAIHNGLVTRFTFRERQSGYVTTATDTIVDISGFSRDAIPVNGPQYEDSHNVLRFTRKRIVVQE